jgi:hypothetical protein
MNPNRQYLWCFINIYLQLKAVLTFLGHPHPHPRTTYENHIVRRL